MDEHEREKARTLWLFVDQKLDAHALYSHHHHHYRHDDNNINKNFVMVRLRTDKLLATSSSSNSNAAASTSLSSESAATEAFPFVLLTLFRLSAVLAWALVKLDTISSHPSTKIYTRSRVESWKAIAFMAVVVFMPSRQPALFLRFALLWAVLAFGYSLLLPGIVLLNKQWQQGGGLLSLSWEEEWLRCAVMANALVGLVLVGKLCLGSLSKKRGDGGGKTRRGGRDMQAQRRKQN